MKILIAFCLLGMTFAADWSYDGSFDRKTRAQWVDFPGCAESNSRQSPINIPFDDDKIFYDADLTDFVLTGYDNVQYSTDNLHNNGHTVQLDVANPSQTYMSGGGLNGTYYAAQLHYHWGADDTHGSEHTFRMGTFPLEVHIVHYKASYGTLTNAVGHGDGLAVLGFFFYVSTANNAQLDPLINALDNIQFKGQRTTLNMQFTDTMPDLTNHYFYRYMGGLTTPQCNEVVVWTVFENKIPISSVQLAKFRTLKQMNSTTADNPAILYNNRLPQALKTRTLGKNFEAAQPPNYHWTYEGFQGVDSWQYNYKTCNGKLQSPINIPPVTSPDMAKYDEGRGLHTLEFKNYGAGVTGTIKNNGHTIQVDIANQDIEIEKGGLPNIFRAAQFHFHWGKNNMAGSEHTHNGREYPLELHVVHWNTKYEDIMDAIKHHDGLAVVGFWFEVGATNTGFDPIINKLQDVRFKGQSAPISGFSIKDLSFSDLKSSPSSGVHHHFYRYQGGLTTPGCNEIVIWTVMAETVKISSAQLERFREMLHISPMNGPTTTADRIGLNYRPPQPLYGRVVKTSWNYESDLPTDAAGITKQSLFVCAVFVVFGLFLS